MKSIRVVHISLAVGGFLLAMNACQKQDNALPATADKSSFELLQARILTPTCATSGCHSSDKDANFKQHGLVLAEGVAYDNLVNKDPQNSYALADKLKRVVPFYSLSSLLYHKLNWDGSGHHSSKDYGLPMPLGGKVLSKGQLEFVRRWIDAGAPRTGSVVDAALLDDQTPSFVENFTPLTPPAASDGLQMKLDAFSIQPNFERELFVRKLVGNTTDLYVNRVQIKMRAGSHHFILYSYRDPKSAFMPSFDQIRDLRNPDNSLNLLTAVSMSNHIFWAGTQTLNYDYTLPEGAALLLPAGFSLDLNAHNVNKTTAPTTGEVYANLYTIPKSKVVNVVQALDLGNSDIRLPAEQKTTLVKSFTFPTAVKVLTLTSHAHKLSEKFVIKINGGARNGEVVYESADWENPLIKTFTTPLLLKKGEGFTSEITYNNTTKNVVKFGLTSADEMGIIFGYYYEDK